MRLFRFPVCQAATGSTDELCVFQLSTRLKGCHAKIHLIHLHYIRTDRGLENIFALDALVMKENERITIFFETKT